MEYEIELEPGKINLMPTSEAEEIMQNVRMILQTMRGSVPLYREFGVSGELVDKPVNLVSNRLTAEYARAIQKWEPRAKLKKIYWRQTRAEATDGVLRPMVRIAVSD